MKWYPVRGKLQANNGEALLDAAIRGLAITLAPTFIAEHALRERKLEVLLRKFPLPSMSIYAIFPATGMCHTGYARWLTTSPSTSGRSPLGIAV